VVIAGTQSGVGKTSVSLGLVRALVRRGLRVQTFKVGPDFLDPTYLALASGRSCYNLDIWMMGEEYVCELFARATADADVAVIEGVMGMYDGYDADSSDGSTAHVAAHLGAPVLLVCNTHGVARSLGATVKGFAEFEAAPGVAGVIANNCGSERHRQMLADALAGPGLPPLVGAVPCGALPELQSRHLGLVTASKTEVPDDMLDALADACESNVDLDAVLEIARGAARVEAPRRRSGSLLVKARIGIARDDAFHFYYADNLEALEERGCELVPFSPLSDSRLPQGLQALYIGGGYPEEHAGALSANRDMLLSVREFCRSGRPVYAECGGLMYLARHVETTDGGHYPMAGVLPFATRMLPRLRSLGYVEVTLTDDSLWGRKGSTARGHEFHYSEVIGSAGDGWGEVYAKEFSRGRPAGRGGYRKGNVLAGYVHLHFASRPEMVDCFVSKTKSAVNGGRSVV